MSSSIMTSFVSSNSSSELTPSSEPLPAPSPPPTVTSGRTEIEGSTGAVDDDEDSPVVRLFVSFFTSLTVKC